MISEGRTSSGYAWFPKSGNDGEEQSGWGPADHASHRFVADITLAKSLLRGLSVSLLRVLLTSTTAVPHACPCPAAHSTLDFIDSRPDLVFAEVIVRGRFGERFDSSATETTEREDLHVASVILHTSRSSHASSMGRCHKACRAAMEFRQKLKAESWPKRFITAFVTNHLFSGQVQRCR